MILYKGKKIGLNEIRQADYLSSIQEEEVNNNLKFIFPKEIFDNISRKYGGSKERNKIYEAYKIGFLRMMLSFLYPELTVKDINKILFERYCCFKQPRTMAELFALYKKKKNEFIY